MQSLQESSPCADMDRITFPALMCDNTQGVLIAMEEHSPELVSRVFMGVPTCKNDRLTMRLTSVSSCSGRQGDTA